MGSKRALAREPAGARRGGLPPPSEIRDLGLHPLARFQLEKLDGTTGKREKYHKEN